MTYKYFRLVVILLTMATLSGSALAQRYASVRGRIVDADNKKPLVAVNVFLKDTYLGSATDYKGEYSIENIPDGEYEIVVEMVGYERAENGPFTIVAGDVLERDFSLRVEDIVFEKPVTITATRGSALTAEVPASVDVVTGAMLELRQPANISEALENAQGVSIRDYGGLGDLKSISLRGSTASQVLILLDGQRLNSAQTGQVDLSSVSTEGVEKIEVVRGGNSALYGADAVGGVINIITKRNSSKNGFDGLVNLTVGSWGTSSYKSGFGYRRGRSSTFMSFKRMQSDGNFTYTDRFGEQVKRLNSDFSSIDVFTKLRRELGDPHYQKAMELSFKYLDSERGSPGRTIDNYKLARSSETNRQLNYLFTGKAVNRMHDFRLQAYAHSSVSTYDNEETVAFIHSNYKNRALGSEAQMRSVITEHHVLTYGVGTRQDNLRSADFREEKNRNAFHFFLLEESRFLQDGLGIIKLINVVSSLRYDAPSDFGDRLSPKAGMVVNLGERRRTILKFNIGTSYRAPSFNDLYWQEDAFAKGNPDLLPESGYDWDAGIRLNYPVLGGLYFESTYFINHMDKLILWQQRSGGKWMPYNVHKSVSEGIETNVSFYPVHRMMTMTANYTYMNSRNESEDKTVRDKFLPYNPRHSVDALLNISRSEFIIQYEYNYMSKRYTNAANTRFLVLDPVHFSNLTFSFKPRINNSILKMSFQVRNIFNKEYQVIRNYPVPGREFRLSLSINID